MKSMNWYCVKCGGGIHNITEADERGLDFICPHCNEPTTFYYISSELERRVRGALSSKM